MSPIVLKAVISAVFGVSVKMPGMRNRIKSRQSTFVLTYRPLWSLLMKFLHASQSLLSSASTDYRVSYMFLGLAVLFISVVILAFFSVKSPIPVHVKTELVLISLSFGVLMFASSYVEEEQQFWYWATSSHFAYSLLQRSLLLKLLD
jgi:GPI ethanolamine phosphate transferase membrane region